MRYEHGNRRTHGQAEAGLQPRRRELAPRGRDRPRLGRVVPLRRAAQDDEGADAARRPAGDARHADLARRPHRDGGRRHRLLGHLVVRAVLRGLRRLLRLGQRLALARVRPRHRVQDPLDERRRLPDRELHAGAEPGELALEPRAAPHRHHHRRPRRRDRGDASARPPEDRADVHRPPRLPLRLPDADPQRAGQALGRGEELHPRVGMAAGDPRRPHPHGDLCRDDRARASACARGCR